MSARDESPPALAPERLRVDVASTWDGEAIPEPERVEISLWLEDATLFVEVDAPYHEDLPPPGGPGPCDGLWNYEVVEIFVSGAPRGDGAIPYTEIELSPHGHHLVLQLVGARQVVRSRIPLDFDAKIAADGVRWRGRARLDMALLPPPPHRLNAYAIHGCGASRRYLAAAPGAGPSPDFHRLDAFIPVTIPRRGLSERACHNGSTDG